MPSIADTAATPLGSLPESLQSKINRWYILKSDAARLAAQEAELRQEIAREAFPEAGEKGTYRLAIGHGKDLKLTASLRYTIDREAYAIYSSQVPPVLLERIIRSKPEVVEAELLKVTEPRHKAILASFITSKPGLPSLEIADVKKRS